MSMFNEEQFKEGLVSELNLYDLPSTQTSVKDVYFEEIRPLSQVSDDGPYDFRINGQNSLDYLDLRNTQLYVRLKVMKTDGSELAGEKVGPANLFLQSLFSSTEVTLQNKASVTCNYNSHRAYIHTLLNYGQDALSSQIVTQGWTMDDSDAPGVTDPSGANGGLNTRAAWIATSKSLDLQGPIFHDLFSIERFLLNQVDVRVRLYRHPASFALMGDTSGTEYKIVIEDIYIIARKIKVNPAVIFGHSKILEKQNALYPYTKVEMRSQSIPTGATSFNWENMFQGKRPNKIVIGFVKSKSLNGDYTTNPFNFEHCSINHIAVYVDGLPVGGNPLKTDFSAAGGTTITRAYTNLLQAYGKWRYDEGSGLDRTHFVSGSTFFVFQIEPNFMHHGEYLSLVKNGNVRLEVQFTTALTDDYSLWRICNENQCRFENPGIYSVDISRYTSVYFNIFYSSVFKLNSTSTIIKFFIELEPFSLKRGKWCDVFICGDGSGETLNLTIQFGQKKARNCAVVCSKGNLTTSPTTSPAITSPVTTTSPATTTSLTTTSPATSTSFTATSPTASTSFTATSLITITATDGTITPMKSRSPGNNSSKGLVIGLAVGAGGLVTCIGSISIIFILRRRQNNDNNTSTTSTSTMLDLTASTTFTTETNVDVEDLELSASQPHRYPTRYQQRQQSIV